MSSKLLLFFKPTPFWPLMHCLSLSVQGRRGSDSNRRSADCKGDLGSGRSIPIKQVGFTLNAETNTMYLKAVSSCGVMRCDLQYWPDESWWRMVKWVFLAASSHHVAEIWERNTRDYKIKFSLSGFVTSIRASCWSAVGTRSTKSGRRSMSHSPTTAYCPIIQVSMWVNVLTEHCESIMLLKAPLTASARL